MRQSEADALAEMVGEICCVVKAIEDGEHGKVRCFEEEYEAHAEEFVRKGQWVRVISSSGKHLKVKPLNVWMGSCICHR